MKELNFFAYPNNNPNADVGPRSASVLTFAGDVRDSFVKELTQNSLDARIERDGKLKVSIRSLELTKNQIPNFKVFEEYLFKMSEYWNLKSNQYTNFFLNAIKTVSDSKINVLVFEDFFTIGLSGTNNGNTFKSCVHDENVSTKNHSDSLGGHGIGKNSVFGYSTLQTVFYSSLNDRSDYMFQGVSKLGTFEINGEKKSEKIYFGLVDNESNRVEEIIKNEDVPSVFRRDKSGLSQFVIGAQLSDNWEVNVKKAFVSNYWLLFEQGKLEVEVESFIINKENYYSLALELFASDQSKENPLFYIRAYKSGLKYSRKIDHIGEVHLHVYETEEVFPNKFMFLRSGMKVKLENRNINTPLNLSGLIYCDNATGNQILGSMEPPAHDNFFANLIENKTFAMGKRLSVKDGEKILDSINQFKKDVLNEIKEKYSYSISEVDFIDEIFNSNLDSNISNASGKFGNKEEAFNRKPKVVDFSCEFSSIMKSKVINNLIDESNSSYSNGSKSDVDGPEFGYGIGGSGVTGGDGKISNKGGGGGQNNQKSDNEKSKQKISTRMYHSSSFENGNFYTLIIRSSNDISNLTINLTQKGDSSSRTTMSSKLVEVSNGVDYESVTDTKGNLVGFKLRKIDIKGDEVMILKLKIQEKFRSSFNII
jgi:hypothetical protein